MSEVSTTLNGRVYTYKFNGKFYTWFDNKNLPVPVLIHSKLREQAILEGKDESIFLSSPKPPHSERTNSFSVENVSIPTEKEKVPSKKKNLTGFNPFETKGV